MDVDYVSYLKGALQLIFPVISAEHDKFTFANPDILLHTKCNCPENSNYFQLLKIPLHSPISTTSTIFLNISVICQFKLLILSLEYREIQQ